MKENGVWQRRLLTGLSWFIALELFLFAPFKFYPGGLFGYPSYAEKFVNWGYPAWFAMVIGGAEIVSAVLLLVPRRRFLGAAILTVILIGAIPTHVINRDSLADSVAAPVHLALAVIVALAYWPTDWRESLALGRREPQGDQAARQPRAPPGAAASHGA
jgi:uncharacterized membrane protein YphA (DoxX/SURF4 family)